MSAPQQFEVAAFLRERVRAYAWTSPEGERWKVTPDGVWLFNAATGRYHLSGWRSAVSDQLLRLAQKQEAR